MRKLPARLLRRSVRVFPRDTRAVIATKANRHGVQLSPYELDAITTVVDHLSDKDWRVSQKRFMNDLWREVYEETERRRLLLYQTKIYEGTSGQKLLLSLEFLTVTLFAIVGTQIAGQTGMHVVGATYVGVLSSMGGATLNDCLLGNTRGGVFWMKDRRFLAVSVGVSMATFYLWPVYEAWAAEHHITTIQHAANVNTEEVVNLKQFARALEQDPSLASRIRSVIANSMQLRPDDLMDDEGVRLMFKWLDEHDTGSLDNCDLQRVARMQVMKSPSIYIMESILTGTAGISGANAGLACGMHPIICCCLGVSIAAGGVFRDVLCRLDVAMGSSSFAFASGLSATVFVGLRQLVVHGYNLPYALRVIISVSAAVSQRAYCWFFLEPGTHFFAPMGNYNPRAS